ncbi:inositol hexakisphosphate kinase 1-like [Mytilus galloprovincialis]|uniref:inositol hexakisphosphate kinase 1-like n=1 Tax=Mytilus galloprovincialis TaxID=29158 RepID=UPI003F7CABCF
MGTMLQSDEIVITPFEHQVGGHKVVLQISKKLICKPREDSEVEFYRRLPEHLKECVPHFKGEIQVQYVEHDSGFQLRTKLPINLQQDFQNESDMQMDNHCINAISKLCSCDIIKLEHSSNNSMKRTSEANTKSCKTCHTSDWSNQCLKRTMQQYALWSTSCSQQFIVLENLLADFNNPCILDMKLGRKQRAFDCTEAKRQLLESRCANSTSASLGFRICGMQLFQKNTGEYISQDKYIGRALDDEGAQLNLKQYFHDGITERRKEMLNIVEKLQHIHTAMSEQTVFSFMSVSLLLIYDSSADGKIDARLIDFANAVVAEDSSLDEHHKECNADLLFGLSSIISIIQGFLT